MKFIKQYFIFPLRFLPWKIYAILIILGHVSNLIAGDKSFIILLVGTITLAFLIPIVGYAWQRILVPPWLGKISFVLGILSLIGILPMVAISMGILGFIVILLFMLPLCYASFQYGFRSQKFQNQITV